MLTEEQMRTLDTEVKQRSMGIDPAVAPAEEADSYAFTPEATMPEQELPQQYTAPAEQTTEDELYTSDAYITGPTKINPNPAALKVVEFTDKLADNIKKTNIYKRVTYNKEDVLREAKDINIETGIPVNAILHSPETLDNARNIYNYRRKQMELMMPGENEVSVDSLMKAYPGLDKIINGGSEIDAAIALQNIKNVRQMTGIVEVAKGNWNVGLLERKMGQAGVKAFREGRAVTEEEFAKYDAIQKQIQDFKETPGFFEDPMLSIVGGTARQIPQQLTGVGTGTLYGGVLAAVAAGATALTAPLTGGVSMAAVPAAAKTAFGWGMRAGYAVDMFENSAGQRYIEYSRFKDKNGKRVLTDEEARAYAAVAAAVETGIEFMNAGQILDVLKGNKSAAAKQIREVVAGATDNATFVAGLKRMLSGATAVAVTESIEEGAQEGADRILSTGVSLYKGSNAIPKYTPGQVFEGALENTLAALPASIGFGISAAGGGSIGLVQRAARLAEIGNYRYNEEMKNVTGVGMVKTMAENTEVKEFFKKDPDVAKQVLKNTVAGTGYEKVNIDTEMVARQENGLAALRDIGERAGMSAEEIQTAVETGADLTVPTEVYFQMRAENENFVINDDYISFSDVAPSFARNKYFAEQYKAEFDAIMKDANTRQMEQQMAAIDRIVQDNFAEGIERDAAAAVLTIRPDKPMEGLKEMRGMYKERLDAMLNPVIRELEKGMKQGVDNIRVEEGRDVRYERVSNNADWAREFYKENKRWPTRFELEGMAIDILSGRDFSKLMDYQNVPEMQEYYDSNAAQIEELLGNIEAFDNIEERIANLDADELQTMEGMSKEAYDIYKRESANAIANAPNDAVKRAAKMGAALLARHADRYAEAKRAAGETDYTAADYYRDLINIKYGGQFTQPQNEQYYQEEAPTLEEMESALETINQYAEPPKDTLQKTEELQKAANTVSTVELNAVSAKDPKAKAYIREQMVKRALDNGIREDLANKNADALLALLDGIVDDVLELSKKYPVMAKWQAEGLDRIVEKDQMKKVGLKPENAEAFNAWINSDGKNIDELIKKYPIIAEWQNKGLDSYMAQVDQLLVPRRSAFKKNGEYKINIDLGTLCMKREAADLLNQILVDEGLGQKLGPSQLEALKDLLKSYGFLTACDVCFVEAKRVRMLADANKTAFDWESTRIAAGITDDLPLGKERVFTKEQEERLKRMVSTAEVEGSDKKEFWFAFNDYMPEKRRRTKANGEKGADLDTGTTPDKMVKIAKLFLEDPSLAGRLEPTMLITTAGTDYLARTYGGHTNIMPTLAGMYGSATSKPLEGFTLYDALSWRKDFDRYALDKDMEAVYAIGGGRAQSFTDFNPVLFLDYVQMVADYEARNLPMHAYTKVPSFVQLFGETGIMINMSFVPEIVDGVDEAHAGLKWNEETQEWDYAWHEDSFPIDMAYELRKRKEYGGRVGIIAVGVSKEHIKKLMADPNIDMIIPYHASGMPNSVKVKTGLEIATDYTDAQTTKIPSAAKAAIEREQTKISEEAKDKIEKEQNIPAEEYLNYSRILREKGDPEAAAQTYLDRCRNNGCTPVFEDFAYKDGNKKAGVVNPGYYKMLEDFRGYDNDNKGVMQGPVRLKLPNNWKSILEDALGDRTKQKETLEGLKTNEEILSKARKILEAQRLDGEIREVMLKRLRSALGQQKMTKDEKNALRAKYPKTWKKQRTSNVQSLKKSEFLDKLEAAYAKEMSAEEAKSRVEVFRMNNGIVYGFAQNGQIFLNENAFNANTPAHEFTHIWAKVAQEMNPKLWAEGVELLKSDAKEMWKQVSTDPLYESIRGDDDAVASEVLSRLVGEMNEDFVRELMDPTQKMPKGKGLLNRIQKWLVEMFNEVRSLFDSVDGKPLTFDEFRRMPLKTLWDVNANKQFRKRSVKYLQDLQEQERLQADAVEMQAAYHGTPNRFERFDMEHIGEGEGHQAHGWGLYFAQDRSVAQGYRNTLTSGQNYAKNTVTINGEEWSQKKAQGQNPYSSAERWAVLAIAQTGYKDLKSAQEWMENDLAAHPDDPKAMRESAQRGLELLRSGNVEILSDAKPGTLFEVDIPENDVLLDEQKEFKDQDKNVQKLIVNAINGLTNKQRTEFISKLLEDKNQRWWFSKEFDNARDEYENEKGKLNSLKTLSGKTWYKRTPENIRNRYKEILMGYGYSESQATELIKDYQAAQREYDKLKKETNLDKLKNAYETLLKRDEENKGNIIAEANISELLHDKSGKYIYDTLAEVVGNGYADKRAASLFLNEHGIKGITYDSYQDGRCFVVFDDKAIDVLNRFFQRQQAMNDTIQGATEFKDNGMRVITVFDSGNESTIAHELGHVFVADLKALAEMPNAPEQIKKDWQTIKDWLGYKDGQTKFTTAQQEKFARGFEAYLRTGEAPATGLRKVFQNFKNWLCKIYKDFLSLGGKPSKDVQAVMGRMLATADEVEQAFKLREAESFEKAGGFDYLAKDSLEMYKRWQTDAQEYAKEKVLKEAMKNLTEQRAKELEAVREQMTEDIRTELSSKPLYRAELVLSANPKLADDWPAEQFGMTYEEYTEAIAEQGTLDEATKKAVDVAMQEVEEGLPLEEIKRDAENAVNTSEYRGMYLAFEQDFIQKKLRRDESLSHQIERTLADIEREASGIGEEIAEDSAEVKRLKQRIKELRYQARWTEAELKTLNRLERANNKAERMAAIKAVKEMLRNARKNVRVYRDNAVTNYKYIKQYAKDNMAEMSVDDATNVAKWTALEKRAGRESVEALKRALDSELRDTKVNDESVTDAWQKANDAKFRQRVFAEYAALATKNKAKVQKKNARLQARQKTIEKNNNIPANERYMYVHGLYVLGLSKVDAQMPQGAPSIISMLQEYADDLQAFFVDEDGKVSLPDYILSALSGNTVYNDGYTNLTMDQYNDFVDVLTAIYKAGIDANKVKSMKDINGNTVLISDVAENIVAEMNERIPAIVRNDITNAGSLTFAESIQDKARRARISLTKLETILEWMGPTAHRYIYETVNQSWNKERAMLEQTAVTVKAIWEPYNNTEKSEMRSKRQFRFGTSILTREEMICVAFNWGTEINRRRIMDGFNVDESTVRELLSNMTQKDWQMVTSVWELVNSYWPETVRVEESMVGVAPEKQSAMPFEIVGKDGNVYKLNGGYYPIIFDPSKSLTAANQAQDDMAKQYAANNAAMNRNRGYLKQRTQQKVSRPVLLSFDVLNKHLNSVIHNICFRESLRDVNRIIKNKAVSQAIQDHFGIAQARMFEQWVRDCWAPDIQKKDPVSSAMEFFRHKQTAAVLGYRATTALLNVLNIFPITDYLGATRTVDAIQKFYSDPRSNWDFAMNRSIFLRERAQTMDRDAGEVLRKEFIGGYGTVADTLIRGEKAIEAHAFDMLAVTDLALACPLWLSEYQRVYQENSKNIAVMDEDAITRLEMEAVAAGDKAVRQIFGSGEMKDLAPVQKGTEMTKALTMYYSYFNVVFNALYGGYTQGRTQAMTEGATTVGNYSLGIRIAPLVQKFAYWTVFTGVAEGILRNAIEVASGGSDDPEEWLKKIAKGVTDNVFGTIPVVRDMASMIFDKLMGEKYFSARPLPAYGLLDTGMKLWNTIESKKKTKIDVFREGMRITNGFTGIGNTLTDAMATTAYWADTDFDRPFLEYLSAIIFDKRIDKKKKK